MPLQLRINKIDPAKQLVYGWASVVTKNGSVVTDLEGDEITADDIREAAHEFLTVRTAKAMHEGDSRGHVVESIVLDADVQKALGINLGMEGWFVGVKVTDPETWAKVQKGELAAFSIGGTGVREPLDEVAKGAPRFGVGDRVRSLVNHGPGMKGMTGTVVEAHAGMPPYYAIRFDGTTALHKWLNEDEVEGANALRKILLALVAA